jgi:hypothetical protein
MRKPALSVAVLCTAFLALPMSASAVTPYTPKHVAWSVKDIANKLLKSAGRPYRVTSVTCVSRGFTNTTARNHTVRFACDAKYDNGSGFYWTLVTIRNDRLTLVSGHDT